LYDSGHGIDIEDEINVVHRITQDEDISIHDLFNLVVIKSVFSQSSKINGLLSASNNPDHHLVDTFQRNLSLFNFGDYVIPLGQELVTQWHEQQPWPWPGGLFSLRAP
jgi:hypothetical protein